MTEKSGMISAGKYNAHGLTDMGSMNRISMEKKEQSIVRAILTLAIPTILEQMLSTLLQYVDTAMVGRLGEDATASVSVTTTVTWLIASVPAALSVAALSLIAQAVGSRDRVKMKRVAGQVFLLTVICGLVMGGVSMALSPFIPVWMGADVSIQKQASTYFLIISAPMVFRSCSSILGAAIRATKDAKTPMVINLCANGLNVGLNYVLIYTLGLGVNGAAIATAVSYVLAGICMFVVFRKKEELRFAWKDCRWNREIAWECARISIPVLGTNVASCLGYVVFASLVTGMGNRIFAAHSIAVTAETLFYIPGYGLRMAVSTLVGIALGEGNRRKFEAVARAGIWLTMCMMVINGVVLYFAAYGLMRLFTSSAEVARIGAQMLQLVAFSEPFFGLMVIMEGIFYGLGKPKYTFYVETISMWGVRILFTYICVRVWHLGLREVWYCMIADNVCKAILLTIPMCSGSYRKKLFPAESAKGSCTMEKSVL